LVNVTADRTGWDAWSVQDASNARARYAFRQTRVERDRREDEQRLAGHARAQAGRRPSDNALS
jgi:electron transport complex protein RnfB